MRSNYLWYQFFRYGVVRPALQMFHSDIEVSGREQIPNRKPVIFVGNHQNALMDALHVVSNTGKFVHFLTRAEPFEMPVLKHFFRSLNMMPVYRARDGFSTIRKNAETFKQCYHRLGQDDAILVFAEANHDLRRRVRPLSKGFTRIAFGAEKHHNWKLDLQVQTVGLNYGAHQDSQSPVHISFGQPIAVSDFYHEYQKDERKAALDLKDAAAESLKKVTMHVPNLQHYPFYHLMLDELEHDRHVLINPQQANARVDRLHDYLTAARVEQSQKLLEEKQDVPVNRPSFRLVDMLMSPLYLFALLNNAIPYQLVRWVIVDYIEDHVFDATAKFLLGLFFLPIWYLVIGVGLGLAGVPISAILTYGALSILTAPIFVRARNLLQILLHSEESTENRDDTWNEFRQLREKIFKEESGQ